MHYVGDDEGVIYPLPTFKVKFLHLESFSDFIIAFTSVKKDIPRAVKSTVPECPFSYTSLYFQHMKWFINTSHIYI